MTDRVGQISNATSEAAMEKVIEHVAFVQWFWYNTLWKPGTGAMSWGMSFRTVSAALLWWIGTYLIRKILGLSPRPKVQLPMGKTVRHFLLNATRTALYALLAFAVIAAFGVPMTSVMATVASAGTTLGLAMQGTLSNLTGGVVLTFTCPFAIGDYIEAAQVGGAVDEIGLFHMVLIGIDNKKITVPNGSLMNVDITSYGPMAKRRLDLTSLVGRNEGPERAKEILRAAITAESAVLQPLGAVAVPFVAFTELQEKGLLLMLQVWCKNPDYWSSNSALTERITKAFQEEHTSPPAQPYRAVAENEEKQIMKIAIVTDSDSGISRAEVEQFGIFVLPMPSIADEEVYREGKNLTPDRFYKLLQSNTVPRTSQPSPGEMAALWNRLFEDYEGLLFIPMSSGFSASYTSTCLLVEDCDGRVVIADTHRVPITMRHIIRDAFAMYETGISAQEIRGEIEKLAFLSIVYVGVEDLKYLKRGGRISGATVTIDNILNTKPPLAIKGEKVEPFAMAHGTKHCKKREVEEIVKVTAEFRAEGRRIWVGQAGSFLEAVDVADWQTLGQAAFPEETMTYDPLSYSVAYHTRPNAFGMGISIRWEPGMRN